MNVTRIVDRGRRDAAVKLNQGNDTHVIAAARVSLKLAALAHGMTRGSAPSLARTGLEALLEAAIEYVGTFAGELAENARYGGARGLAERPERVEHTRNRLELASITYERTRHGADADINFTRAAIGQMCQAAIDYVEAKAGASGAGRPRPKDPTLALDSGT